MQIGERKLTPSSPFCGVTDRKTLPLGQIELPVTFGGRDNFRTESITFDMAHFDLPYNAILGRPALAKFMAVVVHLGDDPEKTITAGAEPGGKLEGVLITSLLENVDEPTWKPSDMPRAPQGSDRA